MYICSTFLLCNLWSFAPIEYTLLIALCFPWAIKLSNKLPYNSWASFITSSKVLGGGKGVGGSGSGGFWGNCNSLHLLSKSSSKYKIKASNLSISSIIA